MMNSFSKRAVIEGLNKAQNSKTQRWRDSLPTWCPGCGHFTALHGLYEAGEKLKIHPENFVVVSGIGCSGRFPFFIKGFGVHSLHGRALPLATGVKIANPDLEVVVVGGDGDGIGIGGGHFPHAARNNFDMTYLLLDNAIYGLTKGQVSPTSPIGMKSATSPYGNIAHPLNPTTLALSYGATFVARVFSKDRDEVSDMTIKAIQHKGFSFVHVLSPCIQFNKLVTYESWSDNVNELPEDYAADDKMQAMIFAESEEPIYRGIFFKKEIPTFEDNVQKVKEKIKTK
jgi:2-oxoglutarate/2-oxoacid ferredoxin oxidoreductase subunit beta